MGACGERGLQVPVPECKTIFNPNQWDSKGGGGGTMQGGANDALAEGE